MNIHSRSAHLLLFSLGVLPLCAASPWQSASPGAAQLAEDARPRRRTSTTVYAHIPRQSLQTYVALADEIVYAQVVDREQVVPERGGPYASYGLSVLTSMKGEQPERISVAVAGGPTRDGYVRVPNAPRLQPGEEVVLFLNRTATGYSVLGLDQGAYRVRQAASGDLVASGLHAPEGEELGAFLSRLHDVLAAASASQPKGGAR